MNQNISVPVHTSLPPSINKSDPYFYLNLHINYIKWISKIPNNYEDIIVKVLWWGEENQGAIFIPRCVNLAGYKQNVKTHAVYLVRVPLNHFSTYLSDMNKLYVDVVDRNKHSVIGRATVDKVDQLAYNKALNSLCGIMNEKDIKIGEIMIAMTLEPTQLHKNLEKTNAKSTIGKEFNEKGDATHINVNRSLESNKPRIIGESQEIDDKSDNLLDKLIEKSKKIRETISINVKDDEINNAILKKTFPDIDDIKDRKWIKEMLVDESANEFSFNDPSLRINTESILRTSGDYFVPSKSRHSNNNTEKELVKLITNSDSFCSESGADFSGCNKYNFLSHSEANLLKKLDKDVSSDDDPCKRDSIIEELFYKQPESHFPTNSDINSYKNQVVTNQVNSNINPKSNDFEIYKNLSQNNNFENNSNEERNRINNVNNNEQNENQEILRNSVVGSNWYNNISSIKVYLDMLWLNSTPQPSNIRSRSQSSNGSTDRERCRRSCDSASSFNNSSSFSTNKPPTPQLFQLNPSHKYYIDYKFPAFVSQNFDKEKENLKLPNSTTRVNVKLTGSNYNLTDPNGVKSVSIDHTTEFPVSFSDNGVIQKWWRGIVRFKLISQDPNKKESVVGIGAVPLRNIISTNNFYRLIPIRLPRSKLTKSKTRMVIGSLALRTIMIMTAIKSNISSEKRSEISFQEMSDNRNHISFVASKPTTMKFSNNNKYNRLCGQSLNENKSKPVYSKLMHTSPLPKASLKIHPISLESLLCVSSIRYVNPKSPISGLRSDTRSCNLYIIARLLWAPDQKIKSRLLWGTSKVSDNQAINELENFKLYEKSALVLTSELLEKLKNNYAILEVWDISSDTTKHSLYGLVKVPVNIFNMSFKNDKIRNTLLNNVYPLLSSDDWINIEDPISGKSKGQIHVLLAIGSPQQIENLTLSKENTFNGHWNRNYLTSAFSNNELVEHSIEMDIESLQNFSTEYSNISMKESYFYIQYYFPLQSSISENNGKNWESAVFRSINNPVAKNVDISDTNRHRFRLPVDCSLKAMLGKHFDVLGKKHILFEVYLKQYQPFPISKSIAKGRLLVTSLFQLINQHSVDVDSLADTITQQQIPIRLVVDDNGDSSNPIGILNLRLCYRTNVVQNMIRQQCLNNSSPYDQPIVRIEILSATGLQCAAEALVSTHPELQYPSVTGLNSHVKFWLTDESNKQSRIYVNSKGIQKFQFNSTKPVPRTFTPKFDYTCEVLLGPIIDDENSNSLYKTLAEKVLCGVYQLNVEVYHDIFNSIYADFNETSPNSKILIGKGRISIADLLLRSSGFMGPIWLPIFSPINSDAGIGGFKLNWPPKKRNDSFYSLDKRKSVGAVEIRLGFLDKSDRKTILQLAMDAGYVVPWTNRLETEDLIWQQMDIHGCTFKYITINIEEVELSEKLLNSIFTPEAGFKKSSIKIITRYRMFKQSVSSSPNFLINEDEVSDKIFIPVNHEQQYCYRISSDLFRYLRESRLEIQVWGIYGPVTMCNMDYNYDQNDNPNDVRLLGSALFDLSSLILPSDQLNKSVSHILPIWKRGLNNCGNSNITVTINICGASTPIAGYNSENDEDPDANHSNNPNNHSTRNENIYRIRSDNKSFPVHVIIEKAVNLKPISLGNENLGSTDNSYKPLNYFVLFPCADENKSINSSIVKGYKDVVWNFECDTRMSYDLLTNEKSTLDFKVYYSIADSELTGEILDEKILIGIVKLDLSLLLKGFERVIGWYNIIDMQGDCQGQIKVGLTPTIPLVANTAPLFKRNHSNAHQLPFNKPFTNEDHQSYLSSVRMRLFGQNEPINDYHVPISMENHSMLDNDSQDLMSKSFLFDTLKEKLKELDNLNETFKKKMEPNEDNNKIEISLQQRVSSVPNFLLPSSSSSSIMPVKVDYGTNTEVENDQYEHNDCNNNNCDLEFKYNEDDFDSDEKVDGASDNEDLSNDKYNNYMACINELETCHQAANIENMKMPFDTSEYQHDNDDHDNLSNDKSESDRYSTSSCEIEHPQSITTSRSSSPCSNYRKSIEEILELNQPINKSDINKDKYETQNDSWDEALSQVSTPFDKNQPSNQPPEQICKISNQTRVIPKFFPQDFDFHEKMKSLKKNIERNPNSKNLSSTISNGKFETNTHCPKPNHATEITDKEASRLSKIFGIQSNCK